MQKYSNVTSSSQEVTPLHPDVVGCSLPPPVPVLMDQDEVIIQVGQVVSSHIPVEVLGVLSDYYGFLDSSVSPITLSRHHPGTVPINQMISLAHMVCNGSLVSLSL